MRHLVTITDDSPRGHGWIDKQSVLWMQRSVTRLTKDTVLPGTAWVNVEGIVFAA